RINAAVFRASVTADHNNAAWRTWEAPFNSDTFFWGGFNPYQPYQDEADWKRFIGRLSDLPRYFDEHIANMRAGLARGWTVPQVTITGRDDTIEPYTKTDAANPLLATFDRIPASVPEPARAQLREQGRKVVLEQVVPAYAQLLSFLREDYMP